MPIFDFACEKCRRSFEASVKSAARARVTCPHCGGRKTRRLFSPFGIAGKNPGTAATSAACSTCGPKNCSTCR